MRPDEIKHFLVSYDLATGKTEVESFGTDYDAAQAAYAEAEQANADDEKLDIVLLSADSLETIKQTHSSYFNGHGIKQFISNEVPQAAERANPGAKLI